MVVAMVNVYEGVMNYSPYKWFNLQNVTDTNNRRGHYS